MKKRILIVGGVAGGITAATRLRRLSEEDEIIVFERGEYISFANCGLPYFIGGVISNRESLLVQTPGGIKARYNIDVRIQQEVIRIDRKAHSLRIKNLQSGDEYDEVFTHLILSPGANPIKPAIKGIEAANNIFTLRTIPDSDQIKKFISENQPKQVTVIGAGFIGLEMVENLIKLGLLVRVIEMLNQILPPLDYEMAAIAEAHLIDQGVELILNDAVVEIQEHGSKIITKSGKTLKTEMIVLAIGVSPENKLAMESGLLIGEKGGIKVNSKLQTNDPDIYAIGDAIEVIDFITKSPAQIPLAWPANRQARLVADIINGMEKEYLGTIGTAIMKLFDLTVAVTGNNERLLQIKKIPYQAFHIHPKSHAGYYPGASTLDIKVLISSDSGLILGAQLIGHEGVDKRIDIISTAIRTGIKASELQEFELAYAPPFSSAKDPINYIGYIAENLLKKEVQLTQWSEIDQLDLQTNVILDVDEPAEREIGFIANSINIPLNELRSRLPELPRDKKIHVYCQVGLRGYIACRILKLNGYDAYNLSGGYKTYVAVKNKESSKY
ncbi:MAG: FAD-dependent oxidoreductase [bacterium]